MQDLTSLLDILRCPRSGAPLRQEGDRLVARGEPYSYGYSSGGVPLLGPDLAREASRQQAHYDAVAEAFLANLEYPHTQEYHRVADELLLEGLGGEVDTLLEVCCGRGEALRLEGVRYRRGIGVDVSTRMLEAGAASAPSRASFLQADATQLPLADASCDVVVALGGVHHVPPRQALFNEVARVLRPGGRFHWREPVSDFLPWRLARAVIYRLAPALDAETEAPLRYDETAPLLERAGLRLETWRTFGFVAWSLLMNSDVLVANRALRHVPGIRGLTRLGARLDERILRLPGMSRRGVQVVGVATKP